DSQAAGIERRLHHYGRYRADENHPGDPSLRLTVSRDVARHLTAACGMADVHGVSEIEVLDDGCGVGSVVIHVVALTDLTRPTVTAAVVRDHAVALVEEIQQLRVPVIGAEWPAVMEHQRLRVFWAPVLVEDFSAVVRRHHAHRCSPFA